MYRGRVRSRERRRPRNLAKAARLQSPAWEAAQLIPGEERSCEVNCRVPRISEFFGLTIHMYWFDDQKHHVPHFHVRYQGAEAVFRLDGTCLEGDLGPRAARLVMEWCVERSADLHAAWECAASGKEIPWVLPLR